MVPSTVRAAMFSVRVHVLLQLRGELFFFFGCRNEFFIIAVPFLLFFCTVLCAVQKFFLDTGSAYTSNSVENNYKKNKKKNSNLLVKLSSVTRCVEMYGVGF